MPTPKKPLANKEYIRPSKHGDRMETPTGINPADYPPPEYFEDNHKALWAKQLAIFAPWLREQDMLTFSMYIDAQIEYQDLSEQIYLDKQSMRHGMTVEEIPNFDANLKEFKDSANKLMKLQDKMCANPYNRARVPEMKPKEETLGDAFAKLMEG